MATKATSSTGSGKTKSKDDSVSKPVDRESPYEPKIIRKIIQPGDEISSTAKPTGRTSPYARKSRR